MRTDVEIAELAREFTDCHFFLGDSSGRQGWDCLSSLHHFYSNLGFNFPIEYKGFNASNYATRWKNGEGRSELKQFLLSLGEGVKPNRILRGDLIVFEAMESAFAGIFLGSGNVAVITRHGGKVFPMNFKKVISIRRLI